jgi:hypothetical protein
MKGFFLVGSTYDVAVFALFLFQMVFMDTAATIPTGAMAERWKFSSFEYFKDAEGVRTGLSPLGTRLDLYEVTATVQYEIWKGLLGRLEYRHDSEPEGLRDPRTGLRTDREETGHDQLGPLLQLLLIHE